MSSITVKNSKLETATYDETAKTLMTLKNTVIVSRNAGTS